MRTLETLSGGEWVATGEWIHVHDPSDLRTPVARVPALSAADVTRAYGHAELGFAVWKRTSPFERARIMTDAARLLRERLAEIAEDLATEMGKTRAEATGETIKAADFLEYYAGLARQGYGTLVHDVRPDTRTHHQREPLGIVLAITPWNDPLTTPARTLAPCLAAGNAALLKPATDTPQAALHLARALHDAGLPAGVLNVVTGRGAEISEALISDPRLAALTFTGSNEVGEALRAERYLEGNVANTLRQLTKRAKAAHADETAVAAATARRCAQEERHADEQAAIAAAEAKAAGAEGIDPVLVAATLRGLLDGRDAIVVDETITHSRVVKRHVQTSDPDSYFYVQGGLGQGIAVALGVKLAARARLVVLTIGDGAFAYNPVSPSYDAAKAYDLPLLIVVFNNRVYKSMNLNHRRFYPEGAAAETGEWLGTDLHRLPRLAQFAEPFGMHTETVDAPDALAPALERALKAVAEGTTAVVDVLVTR
ncbi:aldehyde dehydrogenase family protein [Streptomyces mirabilis]|uniref:aldehyde dehydrogenase family protein n=1 Tax=Streptomyces mirabilis TaxID=68239 RepID=UPI00365F61A3